MKIDVAGKTDVGRVRTNNEDALWIEHGINFYLVADGMGGHNSGERASRMAIETMREFMLKAASGKMGVVGQADGKFSGQTNLLASCVRLSNQMIHETASHYPKDQGMGTTVVAAWATDGKISIAHVGDSRLYLYRGGTLTRMTLDHSVVQEQVSKGLITEDEAEQSAIKHVLTRAMGAVADVQVEMNEFDPAPGDALLLCSDGLTKMMLDGQILEFFNGDPPPPAQSSGGGVDPVGRPPSAQQICDGLVQKALDLGGRDNVTVIVARVVSAESAGFLSKLGRVFSGK